ncbi:MAG: hypothetical protein GXO42_00885 [bacterium]|nr:hypothetical protein [bacterium]
MRFLLALLALILLLPQAFAASNTTNSSKANVSSLIQAAANYTEHTISSFSKTFINKKIVEYIANFSEIAAKFLAKHLGISPAVAKLLEYYIFTLIIVLLAGIIARVGKYIILVTGIIISALIFYNNPQHNFWAFAILVLSVAIWLKKG